MPREVTRHIPHPVQVLLWGRAAGRCEFAGCNKPLYESPVTKQQANTAEKAHIYAFGDGGPRANTALSDNEINALGNLMLVCHQCHRLIDQDEEGLQYTPELLQGMKQLHEERVEKVTGIDPGHHSLIVTYGANIGNVPPPTFAAAADALFASDRYPAEKMPVNLGMVNSSWTDCDEEFWKIEEGQLTRMYGTLVGPRLQSREIDHLSVFAIAPQPS